MNNTDVVWKPLPVTKMQDNLYWMGHSPRPTGELRVLSRLISSWEELTALSPPPNSYHSVGLDVKHCILGGVDHTHSEVGTVSTKWN